MKLNFKKKVLELSLYGDVINMAFPTVSQYKIYEKKLKALDEKRESGEKTEKTDTDIMESFLTDLGLPQDKMDEMYPDDLKELISVLSGSKKK